MQGQLDGRVALVTGASRGIGRAVAMALAGEGARVVGTATSESGAQDISRGFEEAGLDGLGIVLNVTDAAACDRVLEQIEKDQGTVSILVNNAGITRDNLAMRMKDEDWDAVIDTNLKSVFRMSRLVMRGMMKQRSGSIVNIASVIGLMGNAGQANYAASKGGVISFSKSVAKELGSRNVRCNAIAPGFIRTAMTDALDEDVQNKMKELIPLGRFGDPEDVANVVLFLASDASAYVTGQVISTCGGMVMA